MILKENYSEHHIRELQAASRGDPGLIERTLYAFGLLEALRRVGMDFTFKGGTSLLLLLSKPRRLSTDIDIIVEPGTDVDNYIEKAGTIFPFTAREEQIRKSKRKANNNIVKRHFKFTYDSPVRKGPLYILLDVLYEENHYEQLVEKQIKNDLLLTEGENLTVRVPSIDCMLGDKLTAFAPYTTGIPLREGMDLEVIKQFYDVSTLIDEFDDFGNVLRTYHAVSKTEFSYRGIVFSPESALKDTIQAAMCIGSRGKISPEDFPSYVRGTRDIANHVYDGRFSMETAASFAPKVIYMAACLLTGKPFDHHADLEILKANDLLQSDFKTMKGLRKMNDGNYGYLILAEKLLREHEKLEN